MSTEKYIVYKNDLKFKKFRNIDPDKAIFDSDDVEYKNNNVDCDTLVYRLEDCKKNNYSLLDLSYLNLITIPDIRKFNDYDKLKNIKMLFLHDNSLKSLGNELNYFENLEILDVSSNNLTNIEYLPLTLIELACHNNNLTNIISHNLLKRLDCSSNNLESLNNFDLLEQLVCDKNQLKTLNSFQNMTRLICKFNPIIKIGSLPKVSYLDCSNTSLSGTFGQDNIFTNLEYLLINKTNISSLSTNLRIKTLEMAGSKITKLPYIPSLKYILFNKNEHFMLNDKYKIHSYSEKNNDCYMEFK